jgi:hypothetical protein
MTEWLRQWGCRVKWISVSGRRGIINDIAAFVPRISPRRRRTLCSRVLSRMLPCGIASRFGVVTARWTASPGAGSDIRRERKG